MLENFDTNHWIGFVKKDVFGLKKIKEINNIFDLKENILREIPKNGSIMMLFYVSIKVSPLKK